MTSMCDHNTIDPLLNKAALTVIEERGWDTARLAAALGIDEPALKTLLDGAESWDVRHSLRLAALVDPTEGGYGAFARWMSEALSDEASQKVVRVSPAMTPGVRGAS